MSSSDDEQLEARLRSALTTITNAQDPTDDWPGVLAFEVDDATEVGSIDPHGRSRRPLFLAAAAIILVLVVGAAAVGVFSPGDDDVVKTVTMAEAAKASQASTARVVITQEVQGQGTSRAEGELDFEHRRGHLRGQFAPSISPSEADFQGIPKEVQAELRRTMDIFTSADEVISIGDQSYLHSKGRWWDLGPTEGNPDQAVDPWSRTTMLDDVAKLGTVRAVGHEQVRGAPTTRYAATDRTTGDHYDVWVDDAGQAVRVKTVSKDENGDEIISMTMELFDFGAPVSIKAPADAKPLDPVPQTDVDVREVASGREGAVAWHLSTGALADGRQCVQVKTDPALDGEVVQLDEGAMTATQAMVPAGSETGASCGPAPNGELGSSGATLLAVGGRKSNVHYLAGLLRDGAKVTVTFHDGHEEQLEGHDGAFVLFFQGDDWPKTMEGANTTCELQGDRTTSGSDQVC